MQLYLFYLYLNITITIKYLLRLYRVFKQAKNNLPTRAIGDSIARAIGQGIAVLPVTKHPVQLNAT